MNEHAHMHAHARGRNTQPVSLNRLAFGATLHCLTGCAIGEVLGMVIGTATGLDNARPLRQRNPAGCLRYHAMRDFRRPLPFSVVQIGDGADRERA